MKYLDRITFNPKQCGGRPCIRGMRIRVSHNGAKVMTTAKQYDKLNRLNRHQSRAKTGQAQTLQYDFDGNLIADGTWNRTMGSGILRLSLVSTSTENGNPRLHRQKLTHDEARDSI